MANKLKVTVSTAKKQFTLSELLKLTLEVQNVSDSPMTLCTNHLHETECIQNGTKVYSHMGWINEDQMEFRTLDIGESFTIKLKDKYYVDYHTTYQDKACLQDFSLGLEMTFWIKPEGAEDTEYLECSADNTLDLQIDYTSLEQMPTPEGEESWYIRYLGNICCIPQLSVYPQFRKLAKLHQDTAKVLNDIYIMDDEAVYREGSRIQTSAQGFRVFNRLFAGNAEKIFTTYGPAKVKDPASFEAFGVYPCFSVGEDDDPEDEAYQKGYARDQYHLYYFDESSSTPNATILRSCKNPASFQEISVEGNSSIYGKCADNVYMDHLKIGSADPETWQYLGLYSIDQKRAYFNNDKIPRVDLATFEVIEDAMKGYESRYMGGSLDTLEDSRWAKDKNHYYYFGRRSSAEEFQEIREEARLDFLEEQQELLEEQDD